MNPTPFRSVPRPFLSRLARLFRILPLLLVSFHTATSAELPPEERSQILKDLQELRLKHPSLKADFVEERVSRLLNKPLSTEGTISFNVPDKFRREVTGNNPSTTISNGKVLWIYYPKFNSAERYTLGTRSLFDDSMQALTAAFSFDRFEEFYNLKAFREEGGYRLFLTPRHSKLKRLIQNLTLWLTSDYTPLKAQLMMPKGDAVTTTYKNVARGELPASIYEFTPPQGATISTPLGK